MMHFLIMRLDHPASTFVTLYGRQLGEEGLVKEDGVTMSPIVCGDDDRRQSGTVASHHGSDVLRRQCWLIGQHEEGGVNRGAHHIKAGPH